MLRASNIYWLLHLINVHIKKIYITFPWIWGLTGITFARRKSITIARKIYPRPFFFYICADYLLFRIYLIYELIESTLKQTIMCSCFNDFLWLSKYKQCCVHLIFIDCFIWLMFILKKYIDSNFLEHWCIESSGDRFTKGRKS
jgi:hypothetical protein